MYITTCAEPAAPEMSNGAQVPPKSHVKYLGTYISGNTVEDPKGVATIEKKQAINERIAMAKERIKDLDAFWKHTNITRDAKYSLRSVHTPSSTMGVQLSGAYRH